MSTAIHESHRTGIGASQVSALAPFHCNPFDSEYDVIAGACGLLDEKHATNAMRAGLFAENYLAAKFEMINHARASVLSTVNFRHPEHEFMLCHPDACIGLLKVEDIGAERWTDGVDGVEFKKYEQNAGEWGNEEGQIPPAIYLQCQHSMLVCGRPTWRLFAEVPMGGASKAWLRTVNEVITAETKVQAQIVDSCRQAWDMVKRLRLLLASDFTPQKASAIDELDRLKGISEERREQVLQHVWPKVNGNVEQCPAELLPKVRELANQTRDIKAAEGNVLQLKNELRECLQDGKGYKCEYGTISKNKAGALCFRMKETE